VIGALSLAAFAWILENMGVEFAQTAYVAGAIGKAVDGWPGLRQHSADLPRCPNG
jgi:hypothetical protein